MAQFGRTVDVGGNVTVGLGHLLANVDKAQNLQFHRRRTNEETHDAHVENAFNLIKNSGRQGERAENFKNVTHIDLSRRAIELLFDADVREFVKQLRVEFPEFDTYPGSVQLGMLDLAYTTGASGLKDGFPIFGTALALRNWIGAADQSGREVRTDKHGNPGKMAERNKVVGGWFLNAIKDEPFFINPACPRRRLNLNAN